MTAQQREGHVTLAAAQLRAHGARKPYKHVTVDCHERFAGGEVQPQEEGKLTCGGGVTVRGAVTLQLVFFGLCLLVPKMSL